MTKHAPVKTRPFSQEKKIRKTRAPAARPVTPVVGYRRLITGTIPIAASGHPHRVRHRVEPTARAAPVIRGRIAPPAGGAAESGPVYARPGPCSNSKIVNLACCKSAPGRELICPNVLLQFMFAPAPRPALEGCTRNPSCIHFRFKAFGRFGLAAPAREPYGMG